MVLSLAQEPDEYGNKWMVIVRATEYDFVFIHIDPSVKVWANVSQGDLVGSVVDPAKDDRVFGGQPHLHLEVKKLGASGRARYKDPWEFTSW